MSGQWAENSLRLFRGPPPGRRFCRIGQFMYVWVLMRRLQVPGGRLRERVCHLLASADAGAGWLPSAVLCHRPQHCRSDCMRRNPAGAPRTPLLAPQQWREHAIAAMQTRELERR